MRILISIFCVLSLLSVGCAIAPTLTAEEYLLTGRTESPRQQVETDIKAIQVQPVNVADFLNGDQMVIEEDGGQIRRTHQHLWAAPLAAQLRRITRIQLASRLPGIHWHEAAMPAEKHRACLLIRVDAFQVTASGYADIRGYWRLSSATGSLLAHDRFDRQRALTHSGYPAMVKALNKSWGEIVADLAREMARARINTGKKP